MTTTAKQVREAFADAFMSPSLDEAGQMRDEALRDALCQVLSDQQAILGELQAIRHFMRWLCIKHVGQTDALPDFLVAGSNETPPLTPQK